MKKIIPIFLMLCLTLTGCGLSQQARTVNEKYIAPAIEAAQSREDYGSETPDGPKVLTDKSALTEYEPPANVSTRLSDGPLSQLSPSGDYGRLLPYPGAYYEDGDGNRRGKYGLVTDTSVIVLDPVLTSADLACYASDSGDVWLDIYILGRYVENEDGSGATLYALAGRDGSWVTGFDYTQALPMELGVLCISDIDKNAAVCYGEDGTVVFDTANFSGLGQLAPGSIGSLAECSGGYMRICYANGQYGFINKDGAILNKYAELPSYFEDVRPFSEGRAAVCLYGKWNYISTDGSYAIYGLFDEAGDFTNGVAVVEKSGVKSVINADQVVLAEFPEAETVTAYDGWVTVRNADGTEKYYLTPSMTEANLYDKALNMSAEGYWVVGEHGVRMRRFAGGELYFSGASALDDCSGAGLYLVTLTDGSRAVMDEYSRVVVTGEGDFRFVPDTDTGETYILNVTDGEANLYTASGTLAAEGILPRDAGPDGGLIPCADDLTAGLKNMRNSWMFRIKVDAGD